MLTKVGSRDNCALCLQYVFVENIAACCCQLGEMNAL